MEKDQIKGTRVHWQ